MTNAFHYQNTFDDELAQEFRSVLSVGGLALFDPFDWWDFSDESSLSLSGNLIDEIANKGSSSQALVHQNSNQISFDGTKGIGHQYANNYIAGQAGDRNFLHNGDGCEVFIIHKQLPSNNEQYFFMTNDIAGSSYAPGQRFSTAQIAGLQNYTSRTGYTTNHVFSQSADKTLSVDTPVISHLKLTSGDDPDIEIREDGLVVFQMPYNVDYTFKQDDHNAPLKAFIGYTGDIYGMLIYNRELTATERNQVFANLRLYYGLPNIADLSLLIGSSNIDGIGSGSLIPEQYQAIAPRSYIYAYEDGNQTKSVGWWPYEQAHSHVTQSSSSGGIDLSLMHRLSETNTNKQFLIKVGIGGADMYSDFNPNGPTAQQDGLNALMEYLDAGVTKLLALGFTIRYRGCIIGLGENDANSETKALAYQGIQQTLNEALRDKTAADLPIIITGCSTELPEDINGRSDGNMLHQPFIRTAQQNVAAAEAHSYFYQPIRSGELAWSEASPNGIHYDMPSMVKMGIELADMLDDIADDLSDIEGLQLLLDGDDESAFILDNGRIAEWQDSSGNGLKAIQNDASHRPTVSANKQNGLSGVFFDYDNFEIMISDYIPATDDPLTVIIVAKRIDADTPYDGGSVFKTLASCGRPDSGAVVGKFHMAENRDSGDLVVNAHQIASYGTSDNLMHDGRAHILTGMLSMADHALLARADGVDGEYDDRSSIPDANEVLPFEIGGSSSASNRRFWGTIYQVRVYNRELTAEELNRVERKLAIRYGLYHPRRDYAAFGLPERVAVRHATLHDEEIRTSQSPLALWLDADDLSSLTLEASNQISRWDDKSPHGNHALQPSSSQQPTYNATTLGGKAGLLFGNDQMEISDAPSLDYSDFSMFVVSQMVSIGGTVDYLLWKWQSPPDLEFILQNYTSGDPDEVRFNFSPDGSGVYGISSHGYPLTANTPEVLNLEYDGTGCELFIDNISRGTRSGAIHNSDSDMRVGHSTPSVSTISEVVFFNQKLSAAHRTEIINYLAAKWGITV